MIEAVAPYRGLKATGRTVLTSVATNQIRASLSNQRAEQETGSLEELAQSIRVHGLLQPIVIQPTTEGSEKAYEILIGERRWRAAQLAGLAHIPCSIVPKVDAVKSIQVMLVENIHRKNLSPIEEAEAFFRLTHEFFMKQSSVAALVHKSQSYVANSLRLLGLPSDVRNRINSGELSRSHGVDLASFRDRPALIESTIGDARELPVSHKELRTRLREAGSDDPDLEETVRVPDSIELATRQAYQRLSQWYADYLSLSGKSDRFKNHFQGIFQAIEKLDQFSITNGNNLVAEEASS